MENTTTTVVHTTTTTATRRRVGSFAFLGILFGIFIFHLFFNFVAAQAGAVSHEGRRAEKRMLAN